MITSNEWKTENATNAQIRGK